MCIPYSLFLAHTYTCSTYIENFPFGRYRFWILGIRDIFFSLPLISLHLFIPFNLEITIANGITSAFKFSWNNGKIDNLPKAMDPSFPLPSPSPSSLGDDSSQTSNIDTLDLPTEGRKLSAVSISTDDDDGTLTSDFRDSSKSRGSSPAGRVRHRKSHAKSKQGCYDCKHRRIKVVQIKFPAPSLECYEYTVVIFFFFLTSY